MGGTPIWLAVPRVGIVAPLRYVRTDGQRNLVPCQYDRDRHVARVAADLGALLQLARSIGPG